MTTTLYGILLTATGLSHREAATLHGFSVKTVDAWVTGYRNANPAAIKELSDLLEIILHHSDNALSGVDLSQTPIVLHPATNDDDASKADFPTASSHNRSLAIVAGRLIDAGHIVEFA